jgi:hypothetical protein
MVYRRNSVITMKMKVIIAILAVVCCIGYVSAGTVYYDILNDDINVKMTTSTIGEYTIVSVPLNNAIDVTKQSHIGSPEPSIKNDYGLVSYQKINTIVIDGGSTSKERINISITYPDNYTYGDEFLATMDIYVTSESKSEFVVPLFIKTMEPVVEEPEPTIEPTSTINIPSNETVHETTEQLNETVLETFNETVKEPVNESVNETAKQVDPLGDFVDGLLGLFGL